MTMDTSHTGMRRVLISRKFRMHHLMTYLSAECCRLGKFISAITSDNRKKQKCRRNDDRHVSDLLMHRIIEIDMRELPGMPAFDPLLALDRRAERDQQ